MISAFARPAGAQSFFNSRGLGEVSPSGEARIAGLAEPSALSTLNPGIFVGLNQTSFLVTAAAAATLGSQAGNSRLLRDARPAAFNVATPLPFDVRLYGGINQRFGQDFDVWSESLADTAYRRHVIGRGGIYSLRAGLAKALFGRVCGGAEFCHVLGGSRENWRFEVENGSYTSTDTIEIDYSGNTFKVGASYQSRAFSLAACYEPSLSLQARRQKRVHGVITDTTRYYDISLPQSYSLAAAANPTNKIGINAGLTVYPWQDATIAQNDSTNSLGFKNVWRGSLGAEFEIDSLHPLRIGYSRQTWYYKALTGPITEDGIHLGTSVVIPKFGSLDVSGEVLLRSTPAVEYGIGLPLPSRLNEVAGRLTLTLSYSEPWTRRVRRWGY